MNIQRELRRGAGLLEYHTHRAARLGMLPGLLRQLADLFERFAVEAVGPVEDALEREAARWRPCQRCLGRISECHVCDGEGKVPAAAVQRRLGTWNGITFSRGPLEVHADTADIMASEIVGHYAGFLGAEGKARLHGRIASAIRTAQGVPG